MGWIRDNADAIEATGTVVSAAATVGAILAIGYQLNRADHAQTLQAARVSYQNHLNQSLAFPSLAAPKDECGLLVPAIDPSYGTFMEQLTYTAEQMLSVENGWDSTFTRRLETHVQYVCLMGREMAETEQARQLLDRFIKLRCPKTPTCKK